MKEVKDIELGGVMLLEVVDGSTLLKVQGDVIRLQYIEAENFTDLETILKEESGNVKYVVDSDVMDVYQTVIGLKSLTKEVANKIQNRVLEELIPYIATIAKKENSSVLIQSSYSGKNPSLTIGIGILNDLQVVLLNIREKGGNNIC